MTLHLLPCRTNTECFFFFFFFEKKNLLLEEQKRVPSSKRVSHLFKDRFCQDLMALNVLYFMKYQPVIRG